MEWLVVVVFLVFIGGLVVVTTHAVKHANKSLHNKTRQADALNWHNASFNWTQQSGVA